MARKLPIGARIGKVWGWTKAIFQSDGTEVQHLGIKKGFKCSDHEHGFKHNLFYVLKGTLRVVTFKDGLEDSTLLRAGDMTAVKPGDKHRFEAVTACEIIELYWVTLDPDDIRRYTQGGEAPAAPESAARKRKSK